MHAHADINNRAFKAARACARRGALGDIVAGACTVTQPVVVYALSLACSAIVPLAVCVFARPVVERVARVANAERTLPASYNLRLSRRRSPLLTVDVQRRDMAFRLDTSRSCTGET